MAYLRPGTLDEAAAMLDRYPGYLPSCGATDLWIRLRRAELPEGIIDLTGIDGLESVWREEGRLHIGAEVTLSTLLEEPLVERDLPMLHDAASHFASHQVRNLATIGGNIVNDSPAADLIPVLVAYGASITLHSSRGERTLLLEEILNGFKSLAIDREVIVSIGIPLTAHRWYYRKVGTRAELNISKLSLALLRTADGYRISGASLNPWTRRFRHLEALLERGDASERELEEAIEKDTDPSGSFRSTKHYRRRVLLNMLEEALRELDG